MEIIETNESWDDLIIALVGLALAVLFFGIVSSLFFLHIEDVSSKAAKVTSATLGTITALIGLFLVGVGVYIPVFGDPEPTITYEALVDDPDEVYRQGYEIVNDKNKHVTVIEKREDD